MARPAGSPNKRSAEFREKLDEVCKARGYDLIESLVATAQGEDIARDEPNIAFQARRLLTEYAYPKLKALDVAVVEPVTVVVRDLSAEKELLS